MLWGRAGGSRAAMVCPKRPSDDMCILLQALFLNRRSRCYHHRRSHRRSRRSRRSRVDSSVPVAGTPISIKYLKINRIP